MRVAQVSAPTGPFELVHRERSEPPLIALFGDAGEEIVPRPDERFGAVALEPLRERVGVDPRGQLVQEPEPGVVEVAGSHAIYVSQPAAASAIIEEAIAAANLPEEEESK